MNTDRAAAEVRAALEEVFRPAPGLLASSMDRVRASRPRKRSTWTSAVAAGFALLFVVGALAVGVVDFAAHRTGVSQPAATGLPHPIPAPITRTSRGAQVAWLSVQPKGQKSYLVGIDSTGTEVGRIASIDPYNYFRSADGATIFSPNSLGVASYSALDGTPQRSYARMPGTIAGQAFSPDGRWLALLVSATGLHLQVIDLHAGAAQSVSVPSAGKGGSLPIFAPDSTHLYTITDWDGPVGFDSFILEAGTWKAIGAATDGQGGRHFPICKGGPTLNVSPNRRSLVSFCHDDGIITFFDASDLSSSGTVRSVQPNPFWLSPIFTPDGRLLYLHQFAAFGDKMQVVDLATRKLLGPVTTPTEVNGGGPFAGIVTDARAGGVASTVPLSPDGLKLYSAGDHGVTVLRIPDLKPLGRLAQDFKAEEVWVSGDGRTLYVTSADQQTLRVMNQDGGDLHTVSLPSLPNGFVASEHG